MGGVTLTIVTANHPGSHGRSLCLIAVLCVPIGVRLGGARLSLGVAAMGQIKIRQTSVDLPGFATVSIAIDMVSSWYACSH